MVENPLATHITKLNNGVEMPCLGLGVWKTDNYHAKESVKMAIKNGYRMIDDAKQYGNETGVGEGLSEAIKENGLNRKDLFITSKLFNGDEGYESTLNAIDGTLDRLQLTYLDLYLIHWPVDGLYNDSWKAMEKLYHEGKIRAIGISNFDVPRMKDLLKHADVTPAVNQMEFNPLSQEKEILNFCNQTGIQMEAWSPLGGGEALKNETIAKIAKKHNKTVAQVILRWNFQRDIVTIPKSVHEKRIIENSNIFDFELTDKDVEIINSLDKDKHSITYDDFIWHNPDGDVDAVEKWSDSPINYQA